MELRSANQTTLWLAFFRSISTVNINYVTAEISYQSVVAGIKPLKGVMAVGSRFLISVTFLVVTRFLLLYSLIYRIDYMCNHVPFIMQAPKSVDNFEQSASKLFKPNVADRPSIGGRTFKFRSSRDFTGFNGLLVGLILLSGGIATHPGPYNESFTSKANIKCLACETLTFQHFPVVVCELQICLTCRLT